MGASKVLSLVILLVWIDAVNSTCAPLNLEKCDCDHPGRRYFIKCQSKGLTNMPPKLNRSLSDGDATGNFSHNAITSVPDNYFENMQYFDILDFSSNRISKFTQKTLDGLGSKLTHLSLSRNSLKSVPLDAFEPLIRLNNLDLSGNSISSPCGIETKDILVYSLASNGIQRVPDNCFANSHQVVELDLSSNRITYVAAEAFKSMNDLEVLNLGGNSLSDLGDGLNSLITLPKFKSLSLRHNTLQYLSSICRHKLPYLESMDLGYNRLVDLQKYCFSSYSSITDGSPALKLNFEHNRVPSLAGSAFAGLDDRLTELILNNNLISQVDITTFKNLNRLVYLNMDHNRLKSLEFLRYWEDNSLQELSLASNELAQLSPNVFTKLIKLTKLTLDSNYLLFVESNAFQGLSLLDDLSLQYNLVTNLADGAFAGLGQLKKLKLTGNGLVTLKNCTFASLSKLIQFHFEDNLLHCDCDLLWLLPFINAVNDRGIPEKNIDKPILEDVCHYPAHSVGLIVANEVSQHCQDPQTTNACIGLNVDYDEPIDGAMNVTWSFPTQSSPVTNIQLTQVDIQSGTLINSMEVTRSPKPVTLDTVEDDKVYKMCVSVTFETEEKETDCAIYPRMIRKPTTTMAPTTSTAAPQKGMRPGDAAAIALAVILIILIILIILALVYLWRANKIRDVLPDKRKRYTQQPSAEDSDGRSSSQSPSSNGKHDDPLDFRPAEHSPMIGGGGRTYEEHDL